MQKGFKKENGKDIRVYIRLNAKEMADLASLVLYHKKTKSELIRYLIRCEVQRLYY